MIFRVTVCSCPTTGTPVGALPGVQLKPAMLFAYAAGQVKFGSTLWIYAAFGVTLNPLPLTI